MATAAFQTVPSTVTQRASSSSIVNPVSNAHFASAENGVRRPGAYNEGQNGYPQEEEASGAQNGIIQNRVATPEYRLEVVNVVSSFKTHCHVDLRQLARTGSNVEFRRDPPTVLMKLRNPSITASIWSQGKVTCIGAKSEEDSHTGARRVARKIQKCGFNLRFIEFKIVNCLAVAYLPFGVRIDHLKNAYPRDIQYEPEIHPAASWKNPEGGQIQVFQTGNVTMTGPSVESTRRTLAAIYPRLYEHSKAKDPSFDRTVLAAPSAARRGKRSAKGDDMNEYLKKIKFEEIGGCDEDDDEVDE